MLLRLFGSPLLRDTCIIWIRLYTYDSILTVSARVLLSRKLMTPFVTSLLLGLAFPVQAASVRVTCEGIHEFSISKPEVQCSQSALLSDPDGNLVPGFSFGFASLPKGKLAASAAGGSIRGIGYNGGEASALFTDKLSISGDWTGLLPVTVSVIVRYAFAGLGESQLHAGIRTRRADEIINTTQAQIQMVRKGFGGVVLTNVDSTGDINTPADGFYQPSSVIMLSTTEMVHHSSPQFDIRADLRGYSLPNLGSLGSVITALVSAELEFFVSIPEALGYESESGVFLADSNQADDE